MAVTVRQASGEYARLWAESRGDMDVYLRLLDVWGLTPAILAGPAAGRKPQAGGGGVPDWDDSGQARGPHPATAMRAAGETTEPLGPG